MTPPDPAKEQARVEQWNASHPVGTPVTRFELMRPRRGQEHKTKTTSAVWLLGGHTAVVMVEGYSGAVALDALEI